MHTMIARTTIDQYSAPHPHGIFFEIQGLTGRTGPSCAGVYLYRGLGKLSETSVLRPENGLTGPNGLKCEVYVCARE